MLFEGLFSVNSKKEEIRSTFKSITTLAYNLVVASFIEMLRKFWVDR
jgi:hypothetical protein